MDTPDTPKYTSIEDSGEQTQEESQEAAGGSRRESQELTEEQNQGERVLTEDSRKEEENRRKSEDPAHSSMEESTEVNEEENSSCKNMENCKESRVSKDSTQEGSEDSNKVNGETKEITSAETTEEDKTEQAVTSSLDTSKTQAHSHAAKTEATNAGGERVKTRHISSSDSSTDEDKLAESLTITETPENSGTGGHLTSEGDESLESSPEPHVCPPPHYLTANNGMLLPVCMGNEGWKGEREGMKNRGLRM